MSTDTTPALPEPPKLPANGKEFFNTLMRVIEPDLTVEQVHTLVEKYDHETPQEHQVRMERYKKAFALYREKRDEYFALFREQVRKFSRDLKHVSEDIIRQAEQSHLQKLESYFQ